MASKLFRQEAQFSGGIYAEPWREVGAAGQPAFQNSWVNFDPATYATAAFYKDPFGLVHMKGLVKNGTVSGAGIGVIFTLPVGYRPALTEVRIALSNGVVGRLDIALGGTVTAWSGSNTYFQISTPPFRAA